MTLQSTPPTVRIVEVGPRDGLQNIREPISTPIKLELIRRLEETGLDTIELTSVVSPKAIPQLADCREVLGSPQVKHLVSKSHLRLPVLVPNVKGLNIAIQHGVKEIAVFISATEGFSKANINCTVEQAIERARHVASLALKSNLSVRGYVSCIFADPYDGPTSPASVLHCVRKLLDAGCYEVSLGDTLGIGSPANVRSLIKYLVREGIALDKIAGHFHDTYGQAVANVWEAYNCGLRVFDSSVAGLGGCPFAPGASGNVASEDLVYMFHNAGISTGVDLPKLVETGIWISETISKPHSSRVGTALSIKSKAATSAAASMIKKSSKDAPLQWNMFSETEGLQLFRSGVNLKLVLNRPKNGNALTASMISDLTSAITAASQHPQTSRIIITAAGKFFCTGMDLGKESTPVAQGDATSKAQFERLTSLFEALDQSPKVTIACMNGPAFGGGVGLAFACDIRLAVRNAAVTLSEAKLGLCPATISKYVIREWGISFAREAMLSARPVTTDELKTKGLVSDVADTPEQLGTRLDELLAQLKVASPDASRMSKELVRLAWAHAGTEKQAHGIRRLFEEMMGANADGAD
ncbi:hypothetical protein PENARI_c013G08438 [Penicillium arizonense]|uniref:hydroxymethylglutaryl-CoA lyase n=1 Tax=Penicillium arizonense TaxID=1835702 RepID=A0A1F5LEI2_PENAI|nr:hypothetical protein PENARI_c013G08438 [Penicillium arizonense]OGE51420.1 hypothetical protein PENARI_c013G08438 [Penicillium arizonense]